MQVTPDANAVAAAITDSANLLATTLASVAADEQQIGKHPHAHAHTMFSNT
jgi:hypothetical protein